MSKMLDEFAKKSINKSLKKPTPKIRQTYPKSMPFETPRISFYRLLWFQLSPKSVSQELQQVTEMIPKRHENGTRNRLKNRLRFCLKTDAKRLITTYQHGSSNRLQSGFKNTLEKRRPRWNTIPAFWGAQDSPRGPKSLPTRSQDVSKSSQELPREPQELARAPKTIPRAPKRALRAPKRIPRDAKSLRKRTKAVKS